MTGFRGGGMKNIRKPVMGGVSERNQAISKEGGGEDENQLFNSGQKALYYHK